MKDIRIISGKRIAPSFHTVQKLMGCKNTTADTEIIGKLYEELRFAVLMRIQPKAALLIGKLPQAFSDAKEKQKTVLYTIITLGEGISRLADKYTSKTDLLRAMVVDAMADSCLFAFEEQLLPLIRQICFTEGYGIADRLEIPQDIPIEIQKTAYEQLEAERTLGLSITNGYMLQPVKSMCLVFALTKDTSKENLKHNCSKCSKTDCQMRTDPDILLCAEFMTNETQSIAQRTISCPKGSILLEILQNNGLFLPAYCGGRGACGKCAIRVKDGFLPVTNEDARIFSKEELKMGMRLSCRAVLHDNITISLTSSVESAFSALGSGSMEHIKTNVWASYHADDYGIAIDIGTTTLAFSLLNLQNGNILDTCTAVNSQRAFGTDVISRIQAANNGKKEQLTECIKKDLREGIFCLANRNLPNIKQVRHIVIAGNTVMLHLLRGYSCEGFSRYPFSPKTLGFEELTLSELFDQSTVLASDAKVTLLPGISAFVGADITAGLYACDILNSRDNVLFLDLGTNGEMALWTGNKIYTASTAAGPVFEGGNIKWGTGSIPGAISQVTIHGSMPQVQTIGNETPRGICGTGVIETTAELLSAGILDASGKLSEPYFNEGYPLAHTAQGEWIRFMQQDIREIQMAKAAIRAGIEILLLRSGICCEKIGQVFLAGGFGYFLNIKKAAAIGVLPKALIDKTTAAGNTALKGALLYLANQKQKELNDIVSHTAEIPLANDDKFQELYFRYMNF